MTTGYYRNYDLIQIIIVYITNGASSKQVQRPTGHCKQADSLVVVPHFGDRIVANDRPFAPKWGELASAVLDSRYKWGLSPE